MVDFNISMYDIGGNGATAGDGKLTGEEVSKAQNDGWCVWDGYSSADGQPFFVIGGVKVNPSEINNFKESKRLSSLPSIYDVEFNNGISVRYPQQEQNDASIYDLKGNGKNEGGLILNNINGVQVQDNPQTDDIYMLNNCKDSQVRTYTRTYNNNTGYYEIADNDRDNVTIDGINVKPFGLKLDKNGYPLTPKPDSNGNIVE